MSDLQIVTLTNLSASKVDISQLEADIEYLIEHDYHGVCRSVQFHEVPIDVRDRSTTQKGE